MIAEAQRGDLAGRPFAFFGLKASCHPLLRATGETRRVLFPWQQAQSTSKGSPDRAVGWATSADAHWEAIVECTTCRRRFWSISERARDDAAAVLKASGRPIPLGLDPTPEVDPDSDEARALLVQRGEEIREQARRA